VTFNHGVSGSNPDGLTNLSKDLQPDNVAQSNSADLWRTWCIKRLPEAIRRLIELGLKAVPNAVTVAALAAHLRKMSNPGVADIIEKAASNMASDRPFRSFADP
jgi:hypothetical protein